MAGRKALAVQANDVAATKHGPRPVDGYFHDGVDDTACQPGEYEIAHERMFFANQQKDDQGADQEVERERQSEESQPQRGRPQLGVARPVVQVLRQRMIGGQPARRIGD